MGDGAGLRKRMVDSSPAISRWMFPRWRTTISTAMASTAPVVAPQPNRNGLITDAAAALNTLASET